MEIPIQFLKKLLMNSFRMFPDENLGGFQEDVLRKSQK